MSIRLFSRVLLCCFFISISFALCKIEPTIHKWVEKTPDDWAKKIMREMKVYRNSSNCCPLWIHVTKFDAWITYANCWDVPSCLLITHYRSCLHGFRLERRKKQQQQLQKTASVLEVSSKTNGQMANFFLSISQLVSSWLPSFFPMSPNFLQNH